MRGEGGVCLVNEGLHGEGGMCGKGGMHGKGWGR